MAQRSIRVCGHPGRPIQDSSSTDCHVLFGYALGRVCFASQRQILQGISFTGQHKIVRNHKPSLSKCCHSFVFHHLIAQLSPASHRQSENQHILGVSANSLFLDLGYQYQDLNNAKIIGIDVLDTILWRAIKTSKNASS